jgi:hypothetical protein
LKKLKIGRRIKNVNRFTCTILFLKLRFVFISQLAKIIKLIINQIINPQNKSFIYTLSSRFQCNMPLQFNRAEYHKTCVMFSYKIYICVFYFISLSILLQLKNCLVWRLFLYHKHFDSLVFSTTRHFDVVQNPNSFAFKVTETSNA